MCQLETLNEHIAKMAVKLFFDCFKLIRTLSSQRVGKIGGDNFPAVANNVIEDNVKKIGRQVQNL
jgi:hypothetical protein